MSLIRHLTALAALLAITVASARSQTGLTVTETRPQVLVPQSRPMPAASAVEVQSVDAEVVLLDQSARTRLSISIHNPTRARLEAQMLIPVPDGAVIHRYHYDGLPSGGEARLMPRAEARRIYDQIVSQLRDPALLEFVGLNAVRSSVFPIEAGATQKVILEYEHLCVAEDGRIDYILPRSESLDYAVPWQISVEVRATRPISTVYSPSHMIESRRVDGRHFSVALASSARHEPGPFRLSSLIEVGDVTASLFAYPTENGGYFLLLAGLPSDASIESELRAVKREVTLVFDRSGSMQGEKLDQVREAALQVLAGLEDGESFNLIVYNEAVDRFAPAPVVKDAASMARARQYLAGVKARGGTNIHDALDAALSQEPVAGTLPIVLFLTDGVPTVGQTAEAVIRKAVEERNTFERRIFTFGVGVDVNTPLLEDIAYETRATTTFVLPGEDVEVKVASVFNKLSGPVLADPVLTSRDRSGKPAPGRVRDVLPVRLPDLFKGDQVVVLGEYIGDAPLHFRLDGQFLGRARAFTFDFPLDQATTSHAFVPRLWASRKIGVLIDAIREMGASTGGLATAPDPSDPRLKELVDEVVRLSTEFGVLTEYTAFLASEGTELTQFDRTTEEAAGNLAGRAIRTRSGLSSVNQDNNLQLLKSQTCLNYSNTYWNERMESVRLSTVQQIADLAFYQRGSRWIDSRAAQREQEAPRRTITLGTDAYSDLVEQLSTAGRASCLSLSGDILLVVDGDLVLVTNRNPTNNP
ncbi:MAG: VWA domain-containing protein [Phycisphaerales bacterium]|nr:VWA domain-containing protein [Phycisphaerales bacterium]